MAWPVHPTGFFGARGDNDSYRIERSLRFNSAEGAYLNRTPASAGNRKTWTWSGWVKRTKLSSTGNLFSNSNGSTGFSAIRLENTDNLGVFDWTGTAFVWQLSTSQLFRDSSAWYHILVAVDTTQVTSSNRVKIYVNGTEVTSFSASSYPTQNLDTYTNLAQQAAIGSTRTTLNAEFFDGYLTEIHFIDGQALTPSSFGETDAITGRWKAKAYSGTYGTNGFYLKFADNSGTTATTLGKDSSPNGNNWTPNNFSVTAGAGNDSLVDSPTNYGTDTGVGGEVRGNYCTISPFQLAVSGALFSLANGNLDYSCPSSSGNGGRMLARGTHALHTGKTYWEITVTSTNPSIGICDTGRATDSYGAGTNLKTITVFSSGTTIDGTSATYSGSSWSFTTNDIIGFAFDGTAMTLGCYKNGALIGTFSGIDNTITWLPLFSLNTSAASNSMIVNFGQRPFAYTAPTGFKALCTTNLPQPTIQQPNRAFDVVTYTGNGSARSITGLGFSPDLLWFKDRDSGTSFHGIFDSIRGSTRVISSNLTSAEATVTDELTSFNADGFSLGISSNGYANFNTRRYVAWAWDAGEASSTNTAGSVTSTVRVNAQAGVSIVSFTANASNTFTVGHSLGVAPKMIITKGRNQAYNWIVYHSSIGAGNFLWLNSTNASAASSLPWAGTSPTSSVFSSSGNGTYYNNGDTLIAYCFAEVEGFSKFGSYTGNGSADGPFVWCGFRPRWVMIKRANGIGDWYIIDSVRGLINVVNPYLLANKSNIEATDLSWDILSSGFKLRSIYSEINNSGDSFIFAAFAESPFKYARAR